MTNKLILALSLLGLVILLVFGVADPNSPVVWLASTSSVFAWLRAGMIAILFGLMVTDPPRNVYYRVFVGAISMVLAIWTLDATYNNGMKLLDTFSILEFSICAGLTALERDYEEVVAEVKKSTAKRTGKQSKARLATA